MGIAVCVTSDRDFIDEKTRLQPRPHPVAAILVAGPYNSLQKYYVLLYFIVHVNDALIGYMFVLAAWDPDSWSGCNCTKTFLCKEMQCNPHEYLTCAILVTAFRSPTLPASCVWGFLLIVMLHGQVVQPLEFQVHALENPRLLCSWWKEAAVFSSARRWLRTTSQDGS